MRTGKKRAIANALEETRANVAILLASTAPTESA
jgi:hypothetical protein